MFGKILLPIDGSEHAMKAVDYALKLAKDDHSQVEIIHVRAPLDHYPSRVVYSHLALEKELMEEAESIIAKGIEKFKDSGIPYTAKILTGDPADVICREAEENGIELIVMGSRGLNAVSRFVLGSVSSRVLTHGCCPILIVR